MEALASLPDALGIHIDAPSPLLRAATVLLLLIGAASASRPFLSLVRVLLSLFVLPGQSLSKFGPRGSWALITGASDGIGKEYALGLAAKGYNLILVSRTQDKLDTLASDITTKYGPKVSTKTFAMDFSRNLDTDYVGLRKLVNGLDISILINNVGLSHSIPVPFVETPQKEMTDIIMVNCLATLRVTQLITPGMISRKRGLIITMASFGGAFPTPLLATYSGSKAFLQQWSSALGSELEPHGVHVECVQSHLITTAMSKIKRSSALVPNPKQFVRAVLGKIGRSGGAQNISYTSTPYWSHGLMHWFLSSFVGERTKFLVKINRGMHEDIRKRALRKAAREAKNQ
ncbi:estradiol 17-beta-dehydrogenase 12-B [Lophiostoma macrostomum CBS 122681]|uniref:Very-long-chain 3-oxoacyl-CoA reductase n=1 Tax=Lophiostoma macrostomum CBS 122681 TaxID=1314788 RepID=A0A6A6TU00_9PLEO|nr:estradiol 17-beta-dehydrogenase 12-B [Lophiostoma macrostomum CBS 122681]